jgi:hypothetical protein
MVPSVTSVGVALPMTGATALSIVQKIQTLALPIVAMTALSRLPFVEAKHDKDKPLSKYCHDLCHEVHHGFLRSACIALCIAGKFAIDHVAKRA